MFFLYSCGSGHTLVCSLLLSFTNHLECSEPSWIFLLVRICIIFLGHFLFCCWNSFLLNGSCDGSRLINFLFIILSLPTLTVIIFFLCNLRRWFHLLSRQWFTLNRTITLHWWLLIRHKWDNLLFFFPRIFGFVDDHLRWFLFFKYRLFFVMMNNVWGPFFMMVLFADGGDCMTWLSGFLTNYLVTCLFWWSIFVSQSFWLNWILGTFRNWLRGNMWRLCDLPFKALSIEIVKYELVLH